ncbi:MULTISPECIES: hypothetical protein [unclassified Rhizobium]|uniref:hypothetical protein n=1 Tax=unclassified Rhizobium TaxID=2613769 RepID=UPI001FDAB058|nr:MULTISPECIES: hypothetical protein [unclassified Rhizobium]
MPLFLWRLFAAAYPLFDDRQFAAFALGVVGTILILFGALVRTSLRLRRSARVVRSLNDELAQAIQDLNVERLWRLAGGRTAKSRQLDGALQDPVPASR